MSEDAAKAEPRRLTIDRDVDLVVVGGGLAGLSVALEAARLGAEVAVLEARTIGWGASGHHLGSVMPGYDSDIDELMTRVGRDHAAELWRLSQQGADRVRALAGEMPDIALTDGVLEVSNVDIGDVLIARLQRLSGDFGIEVEGWQVERVRDVLRTRRYFHAMNFPRAFQMDGGDYLQGLARLARQAGVRIYENTPVTWLDAHGIRKRIETPHARLRAGHVILAGNTTLGAASHRLAATLLPVWRHAAITAPLGERLTDVIRTTGSVVDADGIDHFRIVQGDRLMWCSPETTWNARSRRFASAIRGRIAAVFPQLRRVPITETFGGATGRTVHRMPQIGQIRQGLWVASGFGRQGLNTTAMAGQMIARGILWGDDRWKLLNPFELVWAGGGTGRVVGQAVRTWTRGSSAASGVLARYREGALVRAETREARRIAANSRVAVRTARAVAAAETLPPPRSQESEHSPAPPP